MAKTRDNRSLADHQRQLARALKELPPLMTLDGEEPWLRASALGQIREALQKKRPGAAETVFQGGGEGRFDFAAVIEALGGDSLFASDKTVILRDAQKELFPQKMAATGKSNPWQALADCLKGLRPGVVCVVTVDKINAQRAVGKALLGGLVVPCPPPTGAGETHAWLQARARALGRPLDRQAAELLYACHGGDLGALAGELEKLDLYLSPGAAIEAQAVRRFLPVNEEFNSFELVNALEKQDLRRALHFVKLITEQGSRDQNGKLLAGEASSHIAAGICAMRFEQLLRARLALDEGGDAATVAERLRVAPWQAQKLCEAARGFTLTRLARILEAIAAELQAAHGTGADIALALEKIALAACAR